MRRYSLVIILIISSIALVGPLQAQFSLGVNTGFIRTKLSGDPTKWFGKFYPEPGFSAGARLDYRFSDAVALSIQPGLNSLNSRYKIMNDSGTAAIDSSRIQMTSLSLPLHVVVWSENGRFFALAGMQLDYIYRFKTESLLSPNSTPTLSKYDVKDFQLYMQFGAGFIVPLGTPYLTFELRYSQGIYNLGKEIVQEDSFLERTKLTNISFVVGLQVPLGDYSARYPINRKSK
jgi:hypothetical protein